MRSSLVRVWADMVSPSRCRYCRKRVVWRTLFDKRGQAPFNHDAVSYGVEKDDNGRRVERLCWNDRHDCAERPKTLKKKPTSLDPWKPIPPPRSWR
jgi:hypothetical protein